MVPQPNSVSLTTPTVSWPHAPTHKLSESGTYFVTASTYLKQHLFRSSRRLGVLHRGLLSLASQYGWQLEAWAVFSNHYHFVGHSPTADEDAKSLSPMLKELHSKTAEWVNKEDNSPSREVWHNFWDKKLTYAGSYMARLNYTHKNPVKHGLVSNAALYPFCSAAWFERTATRAQVKTIYSQKVDNIKVLDDFDAVWDQE